MADNVVALEWTGEGLRFHGRAEGSEGAVDIDGDRRRGVSPMQMLLLSLASCTAADVVDILGKMRVPLEGLEVRVEGDRAPEPPRYYTRIVVRYIARGIEPGSEEKLRRAIDLSHEKYCSALHSLRPDTDISVDVALA